MVASSQTELGAEGSEPLRRDAHECYALTRVGGATIENSARAAGLSNVSGYRIEKRPDVAARVAWLRSEACRSVETVVATVGQDLVRLDAIGRGAGGASASDQVRAIEAKWRVKAAAFQLDQLGAGQGSGAGGAQEDKPVATQIAELLADRPTTRIENRPLTLPGPEEAEVIEMEPCNVEEN